MNLFLLSWLVEECARWHFDKHVVKMIVELAQLLSTAHWQLTANSDSPTAAQRQAMLLYWQGEKLIYKETHRNHPCAIWVRKHVNNYRFTCALAKALCNEYFFRYGQEKGRRHATEAMIDHLTENEPLFFLAVDSKEKLVGPQQVTEPAQAMPDEYKVQGDAIAAYQKYYCSEQKSHLTSWKLRDMPNWFIPCCVSKKVVKRKEREEVASKDKANKKRK